LSLKALHAREPAARPGFDARYDEDAPPGGAASRIVPGNVIEGEKEVFAAVASSFPARRAGKKAPPHAPPKCWQRMKRGEE
jgi:hypothetical protein